MPRLLLPPSPHRSRICWQRSTGNHRRYLKTDIQSSLNRTLSTNLSQISRRFKLFIRERRGISFLRPGWFGDFVSFGKKAIFENWTEKFCIHLKLFANQSGCIYIYICRINWISYVENVTFLLTFEINELFELNNVPFSTMHNQD